MDDFKNTHPYPIAQVELVRSRECWAWIIQNCPICGRSHTHGGGPLTGNPRDFLGLRATHCLGGRGDYILMEATP
jgi:hypothetical protein